MCDCGHAFDGRGEDQSVHYLRSIADSLNSIRRMILWLLVLTVASVLIGGFVIAMKSLFGESETHIRQDVKSSDVTQK